MSVQGLISWLDLTNVYVTLPLALCEKFSSFMQRFRPASSEIIQISNAADHRTSEHIDQSCKNFCFSAHFKENWENT